MQFKINLSLFGIMSFPAKYETAVEKPPDVKNLCIGGGLLGNAAHDPTPVTAPRHCEKCKGAPGDMVKGVKSGSAFAVVKAEDIDAAKIAFTAQFGDGIALTPHAAADVEATTAPSGTLYYLTPADASGASQYATVREIIRRHPEVAFMGLYTPRSATSAYRVIVRGDVLVMQQLAAPEKMKPHPVVPTDIPNEQMMGMAEQMLTMGMTPFDPATYENVYLADVEKMAAAATEVVSVSGKGTTKQAAPAPVADDNELMAAMRQMLAGGGA